MNEEFFYSGIIFSKDGKKIPVKDGISFHSKYSPEREAENFAAQFEENGFFIVLGLCGGYHIKKLHEKFPSSKIIAAENSSADIDFLSQIETVKNLKSEKNIFITDKKNLEKTIVENYLPAVDGNLFVKPLRSYENAFQKTAKEEIEIINRAIKTVSADYSVQKHFGKIWQKNILKNLSFASKCENFQDFVSDFPVSKTAAIIAAGPSLNETVEELKNSREKYFIISTDTAYGALSKNGIDADVAVSVDGQMVSHSHFMFSPAKKTKFVFDLCSNSDAVQKIIKNGNKVLLSESSHPLAIYASRYSGKNHFAHLETGSGTVTIAAANFAVLSGFKNLKLFGADFSYINGLPYAKGTYLDANFRQNENRIKNAESKFVNLLYRTEIKAISENQFTTEILESYKKTMEDFFVSHGIEKKGENEYFSKNLQNEAKKTFERFDFQDFKKNYIAELKKIKNSENEININAPIFATLLPLCAALDGNRFLAYSKALSYTESL